MSTKKNYYNDLEYRKKHLECMKTKVQCECGTVTARYNMHHHRTTAKHQKFIEKNTIIKELKKDYTLKQIEKLIKLLKYVKKIDIKI